MAEIKEHQRKAPELIQAAEAPYQAAVRLQQETKAALDALSKERKDRERDLETHESQVEKMKGRLSELKTNKEYQAHLFEIEMANKKRGEIDEQILVLMDKVEAKQKEVKDLQAKAAEAERLFKAEKQRLETQAAELAVELAELEKKQAVAAQAVDRGLMERYTRIKAKRKDLALVSVKDGICQGCRLQIQPQVVAQVKRNEEILACSYCSRLLYWDGEPVTPTESPIAQLEEDDVGEAV